MTTGSTVLTVTPADSAAGGMSGAERHDTLAAMGVEISPSAGAFSGAGRHDLLAGISLNSSAVMLATARGDYMSSGKADGGGTPSAPKRWFPGMRSVNRVLRAGS